MENKKSARSVKLNKAEEKLIEMIRTIDFGEIEGLKIQNGVPVSYRLARKTYKC